MLLLAEPSPSALAAAVELALDRVGSIDRQNQHEQVQHTPVDFTIHRHNASACMPLSFLHTTGFKIL